MLRFAVLYTALCALGVMGNQCPDGSENCTGQAKSFDQNSDWANAKSVYDFHAHDIHGKDVALEKYRGHVLLIVNVASYCTLTDSNYKQLVELYNKHKDTNGLEILAFPSNQFGGQEPGTSEEIMEFVKRYNVTFDLFEKVNVNGEDAHPLWKWMKTQQHGLLTDDIKWNFTKFIVDKEGKVVARFAPTTEPNQVEDTLKSYF
ncbi:probable phospholipid hydroperoxide glutathione peroxidase [Orussus abietinus]|uniref:probable phospholipid hydroperoxide glutathione peroxidase n=1 Tax=Orussus abietinus TaxID=222816 RepID=UPI0006252982|nr:probable phospholipid hydroperoxide glutathione peroxidase [Orussus abietinus]XP_012275594.1 probable phospholipid hydroperoxide glutathione peroxidase [Orussus abietinus]